MRCATWSTQSRRRCAVLEFKRGKLVDPTWTTTPSGALRLRRDAEGSGPGRIHTDDRPDALDHSLTTSKDEASGPLRSNTERYRARDVEPAWTADGWEVELVVAACVAGLAIICAAIGWGFVR